MRTTFKTSSKEYVGIPVTEVTGRDITEAVVEFGFTAELDDDPVTWTPGVWRVVDGQTWAAVLIGPGTLNALPAGRYWVHVRVTDSPEVPVLPSPNRITIY